MKCPKCKKKYTKDTYVCSNCGTVLQNNEKKEIYVTDEMLSMLGVKPKKKQEYLPVDSIEGYEVIFRTTSEIEANLIKNMLEEEGIKCAFLSCNPVKTIMRCPGELTLIVPQTGYNRAHDIVKAYINSLCEPSEITHLMWDDEANEFDIEIHKKEEK